jgi:hypothetical protein
MPRGKKDTREKIVEMVRKELTSNPEITNEELRKKAAAIDPSVARLDRRTFNGRFVLAVRRALAGRKPKRRPRRAAGRPLRAAVPRVRQGGAIGTVSDGARENRVRAVLVDLALQAIRASDRDALVSVLSDIDSYVSRVLAAAR